MIPFLVRAHLACMLRRSAWHVNRTIVGALAWAPYTSEGVEEAAARLMLSVYRQAKRASGRVAACGCDHDMDNLCSRAGLAPLFCDCACHTVLPPGPWRVS